MEDLLTLLAFVAFILFGLLGGRKKRARQQPPSVRRPPPRQRPARPEERPQVYREGAGAPAGVADRAPAEPSLKDVLAILQGRIPEQKVPAAEPPEHVYVPEHAYAREAVSLEAYEREAVSLETLEGAGEASHAAFHERHVTEEPVEAVRRRPSRFRRISPRTARDAIVWKTIVETPKGLA